MESVEEYIRRRTREFNEAVREEPWNLQTWLDYAAFQDQAVTLRQTRKVRTVCKWAARSDAARPVARHA